jgi:hypothetical protein
MDNYTLDGGPATKVLIDQIVIDPRAKKAA